MQIKAYTLKQCWKRTYQTRGLIRRDPIMRPQGLHVLKLMNITTKLPGPLHFTLLSAF